MVRITGCTYRRKGTPFVWMKISRQGQKPLYESTKTTNDKKAHHRLLARIAEIEAGFYEPGLQSARVSQLYPLLERDYQDRNRKSLKRIEYAWRKHLKPFFEHRLVEDLTSDDLRGYVDDRLGQGASRATINRELSNLGRMLNLGREAVPPRVRNRLKVHKLAESAPRQGFINNEQFQKLLDSCRVSKNPRKDQQFLVAVISIGYSLGWRRSEILGLRVKQVESEIHGIRLYRGETKNDQGRLMILPDSCWNVIEPLRTVAAK